MQTVSNEFKEMCKSNTPSGAIGRIEVIEDGITIAENTDIQDINIEDNCYVNDKFIGTTVAKKVTVNLFNDDNIYDLENKEIEVKLGFELEGEEELVSFGNFIIEKPKTEEVQAKTNFVGYDYMIKFNKLFIDDNTYPIALGEYFANLCNQVGLEAGNVDFINSDYMVQGNAFTNNEDCRTVLSAIAQIAGGIAKIGRDNKVYIINLSVVDAVDEIDGNNYDTFTPNKVFGPINKVILKMNSGVDGEESVRSDEESITQSGECAITISDNPILNSAEQRELVIDNIFNALKGITYLPYKTTYYGYPYADSIDKVKIFNVNDTEYNSYIFNHTINYDGIFSGSIDTSALTKSQSTYKNTIDFKTWKRNTELKVDKINGEIIAINKEVESILVTTYEAEGKNIHIEDSAEEPFVDISLHGESIQEGTPDTPISIKNIEGDISVKVNEKNLITLPNTTATSNGLTYELINGVINVSGEPTGESTFRVENIDLTLPAGIYTMSTNAGYYPYVFLDFEGTNIVRSYYADNGVHTFTLEEETSFDRVRFYINGSTYPEIIKFQIEVGTEATEYEEYKEQTATFPLGEEKLYEGSYLADDGKHHNRAQIVFDGTETWTLTIGTDFYAFWVRNTSISGCLNYRHEKLCTHFPYSNDAYSTAEINTLCENGNDTIPMFIFKVDANIATTVEEWTTYLSEQNTNGTPVTVEYDLAEEEIVAYTEDQQEAWNTIKAMTTYKNITNIISTAYAKIVYVRNNGLSDMYETKQNAEKNYIETNEKLAEQKITTDSITTTVSETVTRLNNDYLTAEQVNAELDTAKDDIEILQQKQAQTELTSEAFKVQIDSIINDGVSKVKTSMGYTFGDDGLIINKEDAETGTIIDEASVRVIDKTGSEEQDLLYAGYVKEDNEDYPNYVGQTIVASTNMIVKNYLVVPNSRFEAYENPVLGGKGTGAFEV